MKVGSDWFTKGTCLLIWMIYIYLWFDEKIRIILILPGIFLLSLTFIFCKTVKMNQNGCTFQFGPLKKVYKWEEFVIKRMENTNIWFETVYFSRNIVERKIKDPALYAVILHPFSSFYIHIMNEENRNEFRTGSDSCVLVEASREEFLNKMTEWGIELEFCGYSSVSEL